MTLSFALEQIKARFWVPAALLSLLALAYLVYLPGLSGAFLFDDFSNLAVLGFYGPIDNWESFWLYLLSGFSGPTGRPVSMLSFLVNAQTWPADPLPFKHTNVLIHLVTGLAVYGLARQMSRALDLESHRAAQVALLTAALWLLHPFWVSTTLYVVQRMAQLSTLFVLLGLTLYVRTRLRNPPALTIATALGTACAIGIFGLLSVLSKENGALLPLLAVSVETTVLATHDRKHHLITTKSFLWWRIVLLGLPAFAVLLYLAQGLPALLSGDPGIRGFTPGERLLAQGQILLDYASKLLIPRPYSGGIFNDQPAVPTDLWGTFVSLLTWAAIAGLVAFAWRARRRYPAMSLAILFFFVGHILESTFLPLELYFEHRNYLPAAFLGFPLALFLTNRNGMNRATPRLLTLGILLTLVSLTCLRADIWGKPFQQAVKWSQSSPTSPRAQHHLANIWMETGNFRETERLNNRAIELQPAGLPWVIQAVILDCQASHDPAAAIARVASTVANRERIGRVETHQISKLLDFLLGGYCQPSAGAESVIPLIERFESMKGLTPVARTMLDQRAGEALVLTGEPKLAYQRFLKSMTHIQDDGVVLKNAAILASHNEHQHALALLDMMHEASEPAESWSIERVRRRFKERSGYYDREREYLRGRIMEDLAIQESTEQQS